MKIAVCIKQVPVVSLLKFDNETKRLVREGVPSEVNPFDVLAMSAAATLKGATGAEVVAITMGPPDAREALAQCIAMGADSAVHLVDRAFAGADTLATARALAAALERETGFSRAEYQRRHPSGKLGETAAPQGGACSSPKR